MVIKIDIPNLNFNRSTEFTWRKLYPKIKQYCLLINFFFEVNF